MSVSAGKEPESGGLEARGPTFLGDLLLLFGPEGEAPPGRTGGALWERGAGEGSWRLMTEPPSPDWKGTPVTLLSSGPWRAWLLGELYGTEGGAPAPLSEFLARSGRAETLNGHFLLLAWHSPTRRWHVWTDRFGTLHAYFASGNGRAAIGTFFPAVAAAASRGALDWLGLAGFFSFGFFTGDRTFFQGVRILRPATHAVFDENGAPVLEERYWHWRHEPDEKRSYGEALEELDPLMRRVIGDLTREGGIAIPISGGLDSRSTVAALLQGGGGASSSLWSYSYGYSPDSVETRIARRIAGAAGLSFDSFTVGPYLPDRIEWVLSCVEGFQDVTQSRQAAAAEEIARRADYVIAAHWGDVWFDDMGLLDRGSAVGEEEVLSHAVAKIRKRGSAWLLANLCARRLLGEPAAVLREELRPEMERLAQIEDADFRVKAFKTEQWSFRWTIASLRMFQPAAFPRLPFYDTRLADFFTRVPSAFVANRRLQIDYLKRYAPKLARIPWQAVGTNLYRAPYFHTWLLPKRALQRAWRTISRRSSIQRNWEVQLLSEGGRRLLHDRLARAGLRLHEFLAPEAARGLLDEFLADPSDPARGYTVSMLLTFAAWLERYG